MDGRAGTKVKAGKDTFISHQGESILKMQGFITGLLVIQKITWIKLLILLLTCLVSRTSGSQPVFHLLVHLFLIRSALL